MKSDNKQLKIFVLGLLATLGPLAMDMYLPAFPSISRHLGISIHAVQLTFTAYTVGFALGQLVYGPLSDTLGRKKVINFGLVLYIIGSIGICFSNNFTWLFLLRIIQSLGASAIMVAVPARVKDEFIGSEAARANSFVMMLMTISPLVAPFIGSWIIIGFSWQMIFIFMCLVAGVVLVLNHVFLDDHVVVHEKVRSRIFPPLSKYLEVIRNRKALGYIFCHGFFTSGMLAFIAVSPAVYIDYFHVKVTNYPWLFGISIAAITLCSYLNSRLVKIFSVKSVILFGAFLAFLSGCIALVSLFILGNNLWVVFIGSTIYMGCLGIISPNANALALSLFKDSAGTASAVSGTIRFTLASISTAIIGLIILPGAYPMLIVMTFAGVCSTFFLLFFSILPALHKSTEKLENVGQNS